MLEVQRVKRESIQPDPGSRHAGGNHEAVPVTPDWSNNWVSNITIKITAPLLWFLVFIGTAVSFLLSGDVDTNIRSTLNEQANHSAYFASQALVSNRKALDSAGEIIIEASQSGIPFTAVHLQVGDRTWGHGEVSANDESLSRPLLGPEISPGSMQSIRFYHQPVRSLVKKERARLLVSAGVPLVLLGIALSLLINKIVVSPIRELVQATRRITDGDMSLRLNTGRQDEFGHLERFFNRMLDQLQDQKEQLQTALESAQAADRIKSQFLANMSHELRTPLNAIIGYSELMMENLGEKNEQRANYQEDLDRIRSSGKHLLTLINDVLDIAKIEAGKMEIVKSRFRIYDLVREVSATAMPLLKRNNNQGEIQCPEEIGDMESDELRIRQVLINLVSNAAKFTRDGTVKLSVERFTMNGDDRIRFRVEDNGIGISHTDSQRLFNEFAQVEDHINGKPVGTGLGLAISRKFCELMGGEIRLESVPKLGSTFIVELPAQLPGP